MIAPGFGLGRRHLSRCGFLGVTVCIIVIQKTKLSNDMKTLAGPIAIIAALYISCLYSSSRRCAPWVVPAKSDDELAIIAHRSHTRHSRFCHQGHRDKNWKRDFSKNEKDERFKVLINWRQSICALDILLMCLLEVFILSGVTKSNGIEWEGVIFAKGENTPILPLYCI